MEREIKFRAWDKKRNKWLNEFQIMQNAVVRYMIPVEESPESLEWQEINDIQLMQFTGLKDKNGKEVFEGDIVTGSVARDHWTIPEDQKYVITWDNGKFHCNTVDGKQGWVINWHTSTKPEKLEIIGNIFENPDLLKS